MRRNLWLVGMMGAGKSAVGNRVAKALDLTFVDVDSEVAARTGCSIATLWGDVGEEAFRDMEASAVSRIATGDGQVVATGGGVVLRDENVAAMQGSGLTVWLRADTKTLARRIEPDGSRPLLSEADPRARLDEILDERRHRYTAAASAVIDTDELTVDEVASKLEAMWNDS
ncbi:MAG: shikimate kinase [Acidimicrobiia bacterium]|nr:shikimate kinase [Acidimicrobiia bacterium]NNC74210.1 shikimate kinase [Acidimicrobiia bacterium]